MSSRSIIRAIKKQAQEYLAEQASTVEGVRIPVVEAAPTYSRPRQAFVRGPGPTEHYIPNSLYRDLKKGERALRRKCFHCGDTHQALVNLSTGEAECRVCGNHYWINQRPHR